MAPSISTKQDVKLQSFLQLPCVQIMCFLLQLQTWTTLENLGRRKKRNNNELEEVAEWRQLRHSAPISVITSVATCVPASLNIIPVQEPLICRWKLAKEVAGWEPPTLGSPWMSVGAFIRTYKEKAWCSKYICANRCRAKLSQNQCNTWEN